MSLRRPTTTITLDGRELSGPEAAAAAVLVELRTGESLDRVQVVLGPGSPVLGTEPGVPIEVSLGFGDDQQLVLTGVVGAVWHRPWGTTMEGLTAAVALTRTRVGRAYVRQSVADIVGDLLGEAEVDQGTIDASLELSAYHAEERRSAWWHLQELARLSGRVVASDADGAVSFTPPRTGSADHALRGGAELMGWAVGGRSAGEVPPGAVAYAAAAEKGADAWHLLHHEPDGGGRALLHPVVRDRQSADAWGAAVAARGETLASGGWIAATGDASIRAGDLVELEDLDRGATTYRVRAVDHLLDHGGLLTRLRLEAAA